MAYIWQGIGTIFGVIALFLPFILWLGDPDIHDHMIAWAATWSQCE